MFASVHWPAATAKEKYGSQFENSDLIVIKLVKGDQGLGTNVLL